MMKKCLLFLLLAGLTIAQTRTNLEIFYTLVDSAVINSVKSIKGGAGLQAEEANYFFEAGELNSLFYNRVASEMKKAGLKNAAMQESDLILIIEKTSVKYDEMFRKGFLGSFYMPRELQINGNYLLKKENYYKEFAHSYQDTISVDSIAEIENEFYPFTNGVIPSEPFFSSILEPAVAIGTTAMVIVLFFTVRSK